MPSADGFKLIHFQQLFTDRNDVDRLPFMVELKHRFKNELVASLIKNLLAIIAKYLDNQFYRVILKKNTGKNLLFNFSGIGRNATFLTEIDIFAEIYGNTGLLVHRSVPDIFS